MDVQHARQRPKLITSEKQLNGASCFEQRSAALEERAQGREAEPKNTSTRRTKDEEKKEEADKRLECECRRRLLDSRRASFLLLLLCADDKQREHERE